MKRIFILLVSVFVFSHTSIEAQQTEKQKLELSFSERIRLTTIDNSITLNNDVESWTFSRWRTYLGVKYLPKNNLSLFLQLGNESRVWFSPTTKHSKFDEIFINQLYVDWKKVGKLPVDIKIGRQNIMLDEGFICLDGQPLTGSRSAYFNAVRADFHINENQTFTTFLSYNPKTDDLLPIINELEPSRMLEEQSNRGIGLYYKTQWNKIVSNLSLYYFHKGTIANEKQPIALKRNVFGGRVVVPFATKWKCITECAYQFGKTGEENHSAYGGYVRIERKIDELPFVRHFSIGSFYLSGDDPNTKKTEGWDPLWSRFPKWSESYIYTLIQENAGKVAYWSNIASAHLGMKGSLSEKLSLNLDYHHLWALEDNLSDFCSGEGKNRGDLFVGKVNYRIDKRWSGHLLWENFNPGDFYFSSADGYNWVRFELMYKF